MVSKPRPRKSRKTSDTGADEPTPSTRASDPPAGPFSDGPSGVFNPADLDRTVLSLPLIAEMRDNPGPLYHVIIEVNLDFPHGRKAARETVRDWVKDLTAKQSDGEGINDIKSRYSQQYLFGRLSGPTIEGLARAAVPSADKPEPSPLYRIWLDHKINTFISKTVSTVKADAARNAFGTLGEEIVWAVIDTGIDQTHPHFEKHGNLKLDAALLHRDFTAIDSDLDEAALSARALQDPDGHGTHVAGIIAGEIPEGSNTVISAVTRHRDGDGEVRTLPVKLAAISGMAPRCKLLSLKVLDQDGGGLTSNLIAALEYVQELNGNGRRVRVHGVNMSVGYDFEPKWFACGQSPLCVEVDRLVQSGVVVVVAAGNTGYGIQNTTMRGPVAAGLDLTINDPGNAELAITVGSTHRDMPHVYGVSYFSSKGPTGDGRPKPDLVAPGEKILSCASGQAPPAATPRPLYREDSGTSMAAPHVSGVIAAFLSVRREFIGQPLKVKDIFLSTATDLKRTSYFQGNGLVDLMRAIQSV